MTLELFVEAAIADVNIPLQIDHADGQRLTVKTAENTRLTVDRSRIAAVLEQKGETKEE